MLCTQQTHSAAVSQNSRTAYSCSSMIGHVLQCVLWLSPHLHAWALIWRITCALACFALQALRQLRSGFITKFTAPGYNCYRTSRGKSFVEPRRVAGESGYVAGVTDRPNRGPRSIGFSPARDVILCWLTYEEAAQQAADSRIYGGIHIRIDNDDGLKLGKRIGENVAASLARLSPPNFLTKCEGAPITQAGLLQWPVRLESAR